MPKPFQVHMGAPEQKATAENVSTESVPTPGRRRMFTAAEKLRIVREAAACTERGGVEGLLRREGIYSSQLTKWRKQLSLRGREGLVPRAPGRKPKLDTKDRRILELEKRNARLEAKLALADKLLALQKKASELLGIELPSAEES